jgi:hypothetical protein
MFMNQVFGWIGVLLFGLSVFNLSIFLHPDRDPIKQYVSRKIRVAVSYTLLLLYSLIFIGVISVLTLLYPSTTSTFLRYLGSLVLAMALIVMNGHLAYNLVKEGFKPEITEDFLRVLMYVAIIFLIEEKMKFYTVPIEIVFPFLLVILLYFTVSLFRYSEIISMIVEPVDLYMSGLGVRIFSILIAADFIGMFWNQMSMFHLLFAFFVLIYVAYYTTQNLRPLVSQKTTG